MISNASHIYLQQDLRKEESIADKLGPLDVNHNYGRIKDTVETDKKSGGWFDFQTDLIWSNIIFITLLHCGALYAAFTVPYIQHWRVTLWGFVVGFTGGIGVTAGVHRLWTHRSYKAKWPLRVILMLAYYTAGQNRIYDWVRDHRVHHKYTETNADPHNSKRGFFFAHVGWLMMRKHPEVLEKGRLIDMRDVSADPVVAFGDRYFLPMKLLCAFVTPILVPVYFFEQTWTIAIVSQALIRYTISLNITWSVNSFAHIWGSKPYDKEIAAAENMAVAIVTSGEGWHNYHHIFPWDYKTAELGNYRMNATTMIIDFFAKIGWAYDLKEPSKEYVKMVVQNRGDGTHPIWSPNPEPKTKSY